jgi:trehalose synthase
MVTPTWVRQPAAGPKIVHVNATATGGGVAELLHGLVPAQEAAGTSVGWAVIGGDAGFFAFTKHLHHLLHDRADPAAPDPGVVEHYRSLLEPQARWLAGQVGPGDVVALHDPQTLGLVPVLARTGAQVLWHCHVGTTVAGAAGPATVWRALRPELSEVDTAVTTLPEFFPPSVPEDRRHLAAPAIDPVSPKNRPLSRGEIAALLDSAGLVGAADWGPATVEQDRPLPHGARVVLQVSRWDPLKDMPGVVRLVPLLPQDVHVVLAGNDPNEIPDDPEGFAVLAEVRAARAELSTSDQARVHLVLTSSRHGDRAALLVNALQRRADVVLQKSIAEGFGLTVTEAMAKGRAVVAADVGGLRQQITDGDNGLLVDPRDLDGVAAALRRTLAEPLLARRMGRNAAESATRRYLMPRLVADYARFAGPSFPLRRKES